MRVLLLAAAAVLLLLPATSAQVVDSYKMPAEVMQYAITDGTPLDLDSADTLTALQDVQARISGASIHDCVYNLTIAEGPSYRLMGSPTQDEFVQAHKDVFAKLGLPSALDNFTEGGPGVGVPPPEQLQGGTNIVGVLPGKDLTKWIVIGGHYDTRELTLGGGALDNASGICTVLELAKAFKGHVDAAGPLQASVVFVWYDGEEWGLYGSVAFAKDPHVAAQLLGLEASTTPQVLVSQSYDMPGLNYPAKNDCPCYGDPAVTDEYAVLNLRTAPIHDDQNWTCWSYGCYEELKANPDFARILHDNTNYQFLVREVAYDVLKLPPKYVWVYDDHYGRSDHIPLIALGSAGMRIQGSHDEEYPNYHQPTDSLPGIYALTGGPDGLKAGYQAEAQAGGLTAFYVAQTGGFGRYGDVLYLHQPRDASAAAAGNTDAAKASPALGSMALLVALAAVAVARRRK